MSGKNTTTLAKQDGFKSQWGFIMAAVGSCVGMANVWRFPMLVSRYGGLTFLIPYFIFVFVISQSGMMEEFSLGRWAGYGPVGSFGKAMEDGGKSKKVGELIGGVPVFASLCLGIGYSVIPMVVSLVGACGLRLVWVATVFPLFHSPATLYFSYPVTWTITGLTHLIFFLCVRKRAYARLEHPDPVFRAN